MNDEKGLYVCNLAVWNGFNNRIKYEEGVDLATVLAMEGEYRRNAMIYAGKNGIEGSVIYSVIEHDEDLDVITTVNYFKDTAIPQDSLSEFTKTFPCAYYGVIHTDHAKTLCKKAYEEEKSKHISPITLRDANAFVEANHRHHGSVTGCKFAVGLCKTVNDRDVLIGVAICGRPVSRVLDNGHTLEINRLCVTEKGNSCSMLYAACTRIARDMGYKKVITYILESEPGTSLKAANFELEEACCGGKNWTGSRRRKNQKTPEEYKQRWAYKIA